MLADPRRTLKRRAMSGVTRVFLLCGAATCWVQGAAVAQVASAESVSPSAGVADDAEIIVSGIRATIQGSIDEKRESIQVYDALSAEEIGDLPALSIGEALETLTGAASHREQGGATEISIRGLGPYLGSTIVNGRAATNGSGDRSVNFSQFPSELFNEVGIYKTQSANMIEGGVAGQISLESLKPLEFGKQRVQVELKANYNPQNSDILKDQRFRDLGYRGTISYVDQFDIGVGEIGIALGFSRNRTTNPEQEARVSDTVSYCRNDATSATIGVGDDNNCTTGANRPAVAGTETFVSGRSNYTYRQNITDDQRDSFFGALQWKPNPDVDINLDLQYSDRIFAERRNDLVFSEGLRIDDVNDPLSTRLNYPLLVGPFGELQQFTGETNIETNSEYLERAERYYGGGLSLAVQATSRLKLSADASYSQTKRTEESVQIRMRAQDQLDIFGVGNQYPLSRENDWTSGTSNTSNDRIEWANLIRQNGSQTFNAIVSQFDVNDHDLFRDNARTRFTLSQDRFNSIFGARADFQYEVDGFLSSIEGGVRFQELKYRDVPGGIVGSSRVELTYGNTALATANQACRTAFPERNFLSSVTGGNPLISNLNAAGTAFTSAGNTYATFDALCLARTLEASEPRGVTFDGNGIPIYPDGKFDSIDSNDVNEKSWAGYVQANFESDLGSVPVRGNLGLRAIRTTLVSNGFRGTLTATPAPGGGFTLTNNNATLVPIVATNSYSKLLPSLNLVTDLGPTLQGRFAVFRALSRPDPSALGYGRTFTTLTDSDAASVSEIVGSATASGNPLLNPLLSWNFDAGLEWYPNKDTILALNLYFKRFNGGFETVGQFETFEVSGQQIRALVTTQQATNRSSTIKGFEVTAAHRLGWLPAPFDGLGFKLSYNFADSNFENQDGLLGSVGAVQADGSLVYSEALIPPANLFGLSKHVLSAQLYYQIGELDLQGVYKYRSRYFQAFVGDSSGRLRYTDAAGVFEARISYKLTKNIRLSLEGINLLSEPRTDFRPTVDDLSQNLVYGPRYFAGLRVKF